MLGARNFPDFFEKNLVPKKCDWERRPLKCPKLKKCPFGPGLIFSKLFKGIIIYFTLGLSRGSPSDKRPQIMEVAIL